MSLCKIQLQTNIPPGISTDSNPVGRLAGCFVYLISNDTPFFLSSWLAGSAYEDLGANPRDPPVR